MASTTPVPARPESPRDPALRPAPGAGIRPAVRPVVLLILDHPENPGHPTHWHARGYGLFSANPFGPKAFSNGKEAERPFALSAGQSAVFRHRLSILPGPFSAEKAEAAWKEFAAEYGK